MGARNAKRAKEQVKATVTSSTQKESERSYMWQRLDVNFFFES